VLGLKDKNARQAPEPVYILKPSYNENEEGNKFSPNDEVKIKSISAGLNHSACITIEYHAYTWGLGSNGRLGHGSDQTVLQPVKVDQIETEHIIQVSCGTDYTLFVNVKGFVFGCGNTNNGK